MRIGFIGSGKMAGAMALGLGDPAFCTDSGSGRAAHLVAQLGGQVFAGNRALAEHVDAVVLAHPPAALGDVAGEVSGHVDTVISFLSRTSLEDLRRAYPSASVYRVEPNTGVAIRCGVMVLAEDDAADAAGTDRVRQWLARVGTVIELPERLFGVAGACSGVGPAYWSLFVEAYVDAAVRRGMPQETATRLIVATMAGAAAQIAAADGDTLALRREVTSPGGATARGLAALERANIRAAFGDAMDALIDPPRPNPDH